MIFICIILSFFFFFFNDTATTEIYTLSLTTLFRSHDGRELHRQLEGAAAGVAPVERDGTRLHRRRQPAAHDHAALRRSEEHTSELQSPCNLVCRLLLEKKKKQKKYPTHARTD